MAQHIDDPKWWPKEVPKRPGVYLFRAKDGRVLYVGKASNLRSRLSSYRRPGGDGRYLIRFLIEDAESVETLVTRTEQEALLLEDTLIKQHKPPHNIRLKDDKSFRMLRFDYSDRFPRLKHVRAHSPEVGKEGGRSRYFGPFASASALRKTVSDLHRVVPLRDCPDSVLNNRSRPCLKHQIGLCSAPCVGLIGEPEYADLVQRAARILSGDAEELSRDLELRMLEASQALEYERAAVWRDRLAALRRTIEGQGVRPKDDVDRDVLGLARRGDRAAVHRIAWRDRRMAESRTHHFLSELPDEELMHNVLTALYAPGRRKPPTEILLPVPPVEQLFLEETLGSKLVIPTSGDRRRMLDFAFENATAALKRQGDEEDRDEDALGQLVELLDLDASTEVMDCFDISNMQGSNVVASRVRFRRGHPDRSGYRRYKIRSVDGQDDFASMHEVVKRSLDRGLKDNDLPDLIVIDGGKPQLERALEARQESGAFHVAMIGLAKARAERTVKGRRKGPVEERIWLPGAEGPIILTAHSAVRHLLERIRDEAHRFAITYHRKERGKITSRLDSIPGVGPAKRKALLRTFGSVAGVAEASVEQLAKIEGVSPELARAIETALRKNP
ncbi:UvrABC system protein C [Planctomycetes bacterium Poly30]|uniref:UvrABC system protein C n=1 Tax=Saltatorellus ferox TaxID=2528018 RepID=A0A518ESI9_9BACT|nr:UvrABC system protein C [Planctomycetes bacterium Poly30]